MRAILYSVSLHLGSFGFHRVMIAWMSPDSESFANSCRKNGTRGESFLNANADIGIPLDFHATLRSHLVSGLLMMRSVLRYNVKGLDDVLTS